MTAAQPLAEHGGALIFGCRIKWEMVQMDVPRSEVSKLSEKGIVIHRGRRISR
jgi:hypothetical protein